MNIKRLSDSHYTAEVDGFDFEIKFDNGLWTATTFEVDATPDANEIFKESKAFYNLDDAFDYCNDYGTITPF